MGDSYYTFVKIIRSGFLPVVFICFGTTSSLAQTNASITITGEVQREVRLDASDLLQMKRAKADLLDKDGVSHVYEGVPIMSILDTSGVTLGRQLRGENLSKYVLVKCADGYQVLFSLAELDNSFTDKVVILADQIDGGPIPEGRGPFRLIVPGEKVLARSSFEVISIIVGFANE